MRSNSLSGPGAARTILLFHIISARPSKQPRMVRTFLKVYMELGSYFFVSARTNKRHHHHHGGEVHNVLRASLVNITRNGSIMIPQGTW